MIDNVSLVGGPTLGFNASSNIDGVAPLNASYERIPFISRYH